ALSTTEISETAPAASPENSIVSLFVEDTQKDLKSLYQSILSENLDEAELLAHRMAGRTAQLGGEKISFKLKKMEIDIRNGELPSLAEIKEIDISLHQFMLTFQNKELI